MIVTAGASHREALKGLSQCVDLVIDHVGSDLPKTNAIVMPQFSETQKRGSDQRFVDSLLVVDAGLFEQVTGEMLADELVVGDILIKRPDEVI